MVQGRVTDADTGYEEPSKAAEIMDNWVPSCFTL